MAFMFLQGFTSLSSLIFCNIRHNLLSVDYGVDTIKKNQTILRDLINLSTHRDPLEIPYLIVTYGFSLELTNSCLN